MRRDAQINWMTSSWGSRLSKINLEMQLLEPGGHGELLGFYFPSGRQHLKNVNHTMQNHMGRATAPATCVEDRAPRPLPLSVYRGGVKVWPQAQKTNAYQKNESGAERGKA